MGVTFKVTFVLPKILWPKKPSCETSFSIDVIPNPHHMLDVLWFVLYRREPVQAVPHLHHEDGRTLQVPLSLFLYIFILFLLLLFLYIFYIYLYITTLIINYIKLHFISILTIHLFTCFNVLCYVCIYLTIWICSLFLRTYAVQNSGKNWFNFKYTVAHKIIIIINNKRLKSKCFCKYVGKQ